MNITIVGAGFAALMAIAQVRKHLPNANIRVIAPSARFIYYPSLIWIPSGKRKGEDITCDLSNYFKKHKVEFIEAHITGIADQGRTVHTDAGDFANDGLIIATGCQFAKNLSGIEHTHLMCQGIESAQAIKTQLETLETGTIAIGCQANPAEPSAKRGVGAVLEFVFGIDELLRQQGRREHFKLVFFASEDAPTAQLGSKAASIVEKRLQEQGIEMVFGQAITGFEADKVQLENRALEADLILFQPPMTGADWLDNSELPRSPAGLIQADECAQIAGFENTYAAGEVASYPGSDWQPKLGVNADIQAKVAAKNLAIDLQKTGASKEKISVQLIYVIDSLTRGMLIKRTEKAEKALPALRLFHFSKLLIEKVHLRKFS